MGRCRDPGVVLGAHLRPCTWQRPGQGIAAGTRQKAPSDQVTRSAGRGLPSSPGQWLGQAPVLGPVPSASWQVSLPAPGLGLREGG